MAFQAISFDVADGVARITLNRPRVMNALNRQMRAEITEAVGLAQDQARVLVLTGAGRAFCSGQDLDDANGDFGRILRDEYEPMLMALTLSRIPTIAAVNGVAAGAGASLALAADVAIAVESAVFVQAFARIGLIPDAGATYWLPRQVGFARAMGAVLFADRISAAQALDWGMIYEVVPDTGFAARWQERALALATGPMLAFAAMKQALRASYDNSLPEQLALEARLQADCGTSADCREGIAAFVEKRAPVFQGR